MKNKQIASSAPSFEENLQKLQDLVDHLEQGEVGLNDWVDQYTQGMSLLKTCQEQLQAAQLQIQKVEFTEEGQVTFEELKNI